MPNYKITGRPKKYQTPEKLIRKVNEYFNLCDKDNEPYTMNGLGLYIGLDRHQLMTYKHSKEFYPIIKEAIQRITHYLEVRAITQGNSAGPIFLLKNLGYSDERQHRIAGHNGKELKWKIEVVRGKGDGFYRQRVPVGAGVPKLVADNTAIDSEAINREGQDTRTNSPQLLPGVVNFQDIIKSK